MPKKGSYPHFTWGTQGRSSWYLKVYLTGTWGEFRHRTTLWFSVSLCCPSVSPDQLGDALCVFLNVLSGQMLKQLFSLEPFLFWNSGAPLLLSFKVKMSRYFHCYFLWSSFKQKNFYPTSHLFSGHDLPESQLGRNPHYANPIWIPKLHKMKYTLLSFSFFFFPLHQSRSSSVRDSFLRPSFIGYLEKLIHLNTSFRLLYLFWTRHLDKYLRFLLGSWSKRKSTVK